MDMTLDRIFTTQGYYWSIQKKKHWSIGKGLVCDNDLILFDQQQDSGKKNFNDTDNKHQYPVKKDNIVLRTKLKS